MSDPTQDSPATPAAPGEPGETALSRLRHRAEERAAEARERLEALQAKAAMVPPPIAPEPVGAEPPAEPEPEPVPVPEPEPVLAELPAEPPAEPEPEPEPEPVPVPEPEPELAELPAEPPAEPEAWAQEPEPAQEWSGSPRWGRFLVMLLLVAVVLAVLFFLRSRQVDHRRALREEARLTAATVAEAVTTVDYKRLDDWLARTQAVSTGGLRDDFATRKSDLATIVTPEELVATGKALRETAELINGDQVAQCLVSLDRTSVTKDLPAGQHELQRYVVRLKRVKGKWLATFVNPVAVGL